MITKLFSVTCYNHLRHFLSKEEQETINSLFKMHSGDLYIVPLQSFWWIQGLTVTIVEIVISLNATQTPVKKQTLQEIAKISGAQLCCEKIIKCANEMDVFSSYVVIILTLEAAFATNLCQSLRKGRKCDVPWSIWEETSQCWSLWNTITERHHLWPCRLISSHSSFHTKFANCDFSHVPLPFIFFVLPETPLLFRNTQSGLQHAWKRFIRAYVGGGLTVWFLE